MKSQERNPVIIYITEEVMNVLEHFLLAQFYFVYYLFAETRSH